MHRFCLNRILKVCDIRFLWAFYQASDQNKHKKGDSTTVGVLLYYYLLLFWPLFKNLACVIWSALNWRRNNKNSKHSKVTVLDDSEVYFSPAQKTNIKICSDKSLLSFRPLEQKRYWLYLELGGSYFNSFWQESMSCEKR